MKMQKMKHEITEIAPNTWCLSEFRLVNAFLAEGKEKERSKSMLRTILGDWKSGRDSKRADAEAG